MSSDSGSPDVSGVRRGEPALPRIVGLTTRRGAVEARGRHVERAFGPSDDVVEVVIETDSPIPVRALGPVLHVGGVVLTEVEVEDETHYRFVAAAPGGLEEGAEVRLGWSGRGVGEADEVRLRLPR